MDSPIREGHCYGPAVHPVSKSIFHFRFPVGLTLGVAWLLSAPAMAELERVEYNHPGLSTELGVGLWAWPLPMDWDGDGDYDLVVSCPDKPYNGTYFFENPDGPVKFPVFKPGIKVGPGMKDVQVSHIDGTPHVLRANKEFTDFLGKRFGASRPILSDAKIHQGKGNGRFNVWSYADYNGDQALDLVVGADDWGYYGWDDGYDAQGNWKRGPLHGYVYVIPNRGTTENPDYGEPFRVRGGGEDVNVYGNPQPNFADFDGDGDLDLICGEFLDSFTYFENTGTPTEPHYEKGRRLRNAGQTVSMDLEMITPTAMDWDRDGDVDLICGDEDGRVALIENTGQVQAGMPLFKQPVYFRQQAKYIKFGALITPVSFDWDGDGDEDIVAGNTAGYIGFIENLDGGNPPRWAAPVRLKADGETLRIQAGPNGSIQGPAEAKWGYTTLSIADWDHDGLPDLVVNSIWGKVVWFRNVGTRSAPALEAAQPVRVAWQGPTPKPAWFWWEPEPNTLATQWRTTPTAVDWNDDGLTDLVMLDHEGYLAFFERSKHDGELVLLPGKRVFLGGTFDSRQKHIEPSGPLRLNNRVNGGSGRRKLCMVDWNGDGLRDVLINSTNAHLLLNESKNGPPWTFKDMGAISKRALAGHTTSPTTVDWDGDGIRDLLVGAEDGFLYHMPHESVSGGNE